jgi:hypothetical protein
MRLLDTVGAGDVWLPLEAIAEAKLVLTDALLKAAPPASPNRPASSNRLNAQTN